MPQNLEMNNLLQLAELPYFEVRENRLKLKPEFGPILDMHAHLALAFLFPHSVNLLKEWPQTYYYLPQDKPFSLQKYTSHNISPKDLKRCKRDLTLFGLTPWGMRKTHTLPNLYRDMMDTGVEKTLLLAIDHPLISHNSEAYLRACRNRNEFVVFGSVHPLTPKIERRIDKLIKMGIRGIKMHPAAQAIRPDHPRAMDLYRICGERGLPVFFHCGPVGVEPELGRRRSQVRLYREPIEKNPNTLFVLGHSGALQVKEGLQLALDFPNVYLELVCQALANMEMLFEKGPEDRIFYGSDWPFYHQAITLCKVFLATEGNPHLRRKVVYENGRAFLEKIGAWEDG